MKAKWLWAAVIGLSLHTPAWAEDTALEHFTASLQTLEGEFRQSVSASGKATQEATGRMALKRPGRFLWDYTRPYRQTLIADGDALWVYDPDLEQATRKPLDEALRNAPVSIFLEDRPLGEDFLITALGEEDGLSWFSLKPRRDVSDFSLIEIGMHEGLIRQMRLTDALEQRTLVSFSALKLNEPIDDSRFAFTPPEGVDVVRGAR